MLKLKSLFHFILQLNNLKKVLQMIIDYYNEVIDRVH